MTWGELGWAVAAMTAIVAARYLVVAATVHALVWRAPAGPAAGMTRLSRRRPDARQIRGEIGLSLLSSFLYAAPAAAAATAWAHGGTRLYSDLSPAAWPGMALSALAVLLVQDTHYYWLHRLMHWRPLFRWLHAGHHRHVEPSAFGGFAFDPAEALLSGWLLPLLAFVVPIEAHLAVALLLAMTVTGVLNHAGAEVWPRRALEGPLGRMLITASHHSQHHARYGRNFGLHLQLWDRCMGTNSPPLAHPAWSRAAAPSPSAAPPPVAAPVAGGAAAMVSARTPASP